MKPKHLFLTTTLILALGACRSAPLYNVQNTQVKTYKTNHSQTDVEKAILKAGLGLGWKMDVVSPGTIRGTLNLRSHQAVVLITFDEKEYDITYESSQNLDYYQGQIHKNYNSWIRNLDNAIQRELIG
ncbi:MAG: hypothetical protein M3Q07_21930 [Pseudobdellovibrionaceae bacterium]|nr:hypothetical protein [Pseudobdellovibrionaceae bacterium]